VKQVGALFALALAGCAAPPPGGGGIVSINPCADAMLVQLVPAERIAAISHYSRDPGASSIPLEVARRFRTTSGTAEEVIALRPDIVVASSFTPPATRSAFARAGIETLYLDMPATIAASRAQVLDLARAVGAPVAGAAMAARIDALPPPPDGPPVPALLWIGGNMVSGGGTLLDEMMARTGFSNVAADYGLRFTGELPIEQIIARPPRVMLAPDGNAHDSDSRAARLRARALSASGAQVTQAHFPRRLINCGGPVIPDAMARLAEVRRSVIGS
jgi:iron complex transport system substrate-binding protein